MRDVASPPSSASAPVCRICWESTCEANGSDAFLTPTPCACRDERSNVHQDCLERWILEARSQGRFDCGTVCHACGTHYAHPALDETVLSASAKAAVPVGNAREHDTREPIAIVGGTGYVGRSVCLHLVNHPTFRLGAVVGSAATAGKPFSSVFEKKEEALVEHYGADLWKPQVFPQEFMSVRVSSVEEVIARRECRVALSFIAPEHGEIEDALGAAGVKVFSISPHARFDPANPLSVPEANPETLRDAVAESFKFANKEEDAKSLVKSPNCVTCGVAVALKALDDVKKWGGVRDVAITTFQSLSGRGDAKYPRELVMGNVYPLKGTVERTGEYQKGELKRLMPGVERVSVGAYRVPVQKGHLVDVRVRFKGRGAWAKDDDSRTDGDELGSGGPFERPREEEGERPTKPTAAEIKAAFESFDPLRDAPLPSKPARAIFVKPLDEPFVSSAGPASTTTRLTPAPPRLGTPRPKDDCEFENGMAICVGNIDVEDDCFDVAFCVVVNNVARGAWGAAMLNAEYWSYLRNRKPDPSA